MIDGVRIREATLHTDDRGELCEVYDPRWGWMSEPLVYVYFVTVRPGATKGWALHKTHEDRYFIVNGELEVVLYDPRPDSPTEGRVQKVYLSEHRRRLLSIPAGVWHADHNIGDTKALILNLPTEPYDHAAPDKYRLPLDTDQIPYRFQNTYGY